MLLYFKDKDFFGDLIESLNYLLKKKKMRLVIDVRIVIFKVRR